jgi:hypothetical protein
MIPGRIVLSLGLALLAAGATLGSAGARQDVTATRQIDLTITQGTSMAAAASPDGQSIAIDLLGEIWILPSRGGEAKKITPELLEARQPVVARQPVDCIPGLRGRRLAHLRHRARRRQCEGHHKRAVRRPRTRMVARRFKHRLLVGSVRRHHHHLASHSRHRRGESDQQARELDAGVVTG